MNFAQNRSNPQRHLVGIAAVILFHGLIVYALVTGLAKKVVDVVRAPIETKVIEEAKKPPPPPPDIAVPPPPRLEAPPPPFIPPPEVQIATPAPVQPAITAVPTPPPPAPMVIAPAPPPVVAAAPPPPRPSSISAHCTRMPAPELPDVDFVGRISLVARATIKGNKLETAEMVPGSFTGTNDRRIQRAFANAVTLAMRSYSCTGDNIVVEQPFVFNITN